jgi:metal-responsive CopG/Arc/MetJ family transcriptional regulator
MISRNTQVLSVSLPPEIYNEINRIAKNEKKTKSAMIREMVKIYRRWRFERDWSKIRAMGEDIKKKFNIKNENELLEYIHGD